jgi:hypothetical protein
MEKEFFVSGLVFTLDESPEEDSSKLKKRYALSSEEEEVGTKNHGETVLFKAFAQKGNKNIAQPASEHRIIWRVDAKGKPTLKNMGDVFGPDQINSDAFIAPRDGLYHVIIWANWRADKELADGKIEKIALPAEVFVVDPFSGKHQQIGRGHGGCMFELFKNQRLVFIMKNTHSCRVQVDVENTFVNIGSFSLS